MNKTVRVRIAPSPTGAIHVGLARTALFNYLFAKQEQGQFVLRIEDTDDQRSKQEYEKHILEGFHWLGFSWDEGPDVGGPYGPYRQSERSELYTSYLQRLLVQGALYPCYCTQEELEQDRKQQQTKKLPLIYSGRCRKATEAERQVWKQEGRKPIYRFAVPHEVVTFHDLIRGDVQFSTDQIGDFSVAKSLTSPLYNFAVVIDDMLMKITHVIRGEDHISNTPKQLLLFRALGAEPPVYGHVPLLLAPNRAKLSKRDAVTSILEYRSRGYVPEALVNFLALLGWHPKDDRELFSIEELVAVFRLEDVQKSGAIFDQKKLDHLNSLYLRALPPVELIRRAGESLAEVRQHLGQQRLEHAVQLAQERLTTLQELPEALRFFSVLPDYAGALLIPKKGNHARTQTILEELRVFFGSLDDVGFAESTLHDTTIAWLKDKDYSNAEALWPLRVALSGSERSPGVFAIASILGKSETLGRMHQALEKLKVL